MSFMRGEWYIYPTDGGVLINHHSGSVLMPLDVLQELAAMIWHNMEPEAQQAAVRRAAENHAGNFSADGVLRALGLPTAVDMVRQALADLPRPGDDQPSGQP